MLTGRFPPMVVIARAHTVAQRRHPVVLREAGRCARPQRHNGCDIRAIMPGRESRRWRSAVGPADAASALVPSSSRTHSKCAHAAVFRRPAQNSSAHNEPSDQATLPSQK
jgi:hypothetical protein